MKKNKTVIAGISLVLALAVCGCTMSKKDAAQKPAQTEKVQLTSELESLPEESYLTLKNGVYTATGGALQMTVPKDFRISEEDATILVAGKDTKDFVSVQVAPKDTNFSSYDKDSFDTYYNRIFDNYQARKYTKTTIQGLPAACLEYTFSKDDSDITAYEYIMDGDCIYLICFTDVSGALKEEIPDILDSIKIR